MAYTNLSAALVSVVAMLSAGCLHAGDGEQSTPRTGPTVAPVTLANRGTSEAAYVVDNRLFRPGGDGPVKLAGAVNVNLGGNLAPVAVQNPAGTAIVYTSWRGRRPVLRLRDERTGVDSVLEEGAHSAAWDRAGRLAYFKATRPDFGDPRRYLGHVVVRTSRARPPRAWTPRAGRYVVAGWARGMVVAYRLGTGFPDLVVLDGPGRERVLARGSALVALSPDGARAFVSRYGVTPPLVRVLDVASGGEIARLGVDRGTAAYVVESGSWVGDRVFATSTTGVVVFRVTATGIAVERVLRTEHQFPGGIGETRAVGDRGRVVTFGELPSQPREAVPRAALVECDVETFRCVRVAVASSAAPPRPIYNPSRP